MVTFALILLRSRVQLPRFTRHVLIIKLIKTKLLNITKILKYIMIYRE